MLLNSISLSKYLCIFVSFVREEKRRGRFEEAIKRRKKNLTQGVFFYRIVYWVLKKPVNKPGFDRFECISDPIIEPTRNDLRFRFFSVKSPVRSGFDNTALLFSDLLLSDPSKLLKARKMVRGEIYFFLLFFFLREEIWEPRRWGFVGGLWKKEICCQLIKIWFI